MRTGVLFTLLALALIALAPTSHAQGNECLVEIHNESGAVPDNTGLCATATGKTCVFNLELCLNQPESGCTPASFTKKRFHATGHCGPVNALEVTSSGTDAVCGTPTPIKVRTRLNGKRPGQCTIRAAVQSAKAGARKDVDKVVLTCMPSSATCPVVTTTTTATTTTTTTT